MTFLMTNTGCDVEVSKKRGVVVLRFTPPIGDAWLYEFEPEQARIIATAMMAGSHLLAPTPKRSQH